MSRWIRLDTTWSQSEWVSALEPESRLAWIELLCHVKAHGYAGSVKRLTPAVAARMWGLRVTAVTDMEGAAIADDALVIDDDEWVITGWSSRQSDPKAAERMRRYRERQQQLAEESQPEPVTRNSRNVTGVTPTETETETGTKTEQKQPSHIADAMVRVRSAYPKRTGGQRWGEVKPRLTRVLKTTPLSDVLAAVEAYAAMCDQTEKTGTALVMQAATFFGKAEGWLEDWTVHGPPAQPRGMSNGSLRSQLEAER